MSNKKNPIAAAHIARMNSVLAQLAQARRELRKIDAESPHRLVVLRRIDQLLDDYLVLRPHLENL